MMMDNNYKNNINNKNAVQCDQIEEAANSPRFATEEEILASFGYKQVPRLVRFDGKSTCHLSYVLVI